jgi:hypothetical protein
MIFANIFQKIQSILFSHSSDNWGESLLKRDKQNLDTIIGGGGGMVVGGM